jgi:hypothetical protein
MGTDLGDSEQTPNDLATVTDYSQLTAMLGGRAALLTYNAKDNCCFAAGHALPPLVEAARPVFALYGRPERLRTHINYVPGTHNFEVDNREALYRMVGAIFFPEAKDFNGKEIPSEPEVKSAAELNVPLPPENLDFHKIAVKLSESLPRVTDEPPDERRARLAKLLSYARYAIRAETAGQSPAGATTAKYWRMRIGEVWTIPVAELSRGEPKGTVLVVAAEGRQSAAAEVEAHLAAGQRVLAVDPFYLGESKISARGYLYSLLLAATGARHAGLQASQIAAVARWAQQQWPGQPVAVEGIGQSCTVPALAAGALEKAIASVKLTRPLASLREVIDQDLSQDKHPELFCFGLLEAFDLPQIKELVETK